jgi:ankyrin repeat protein
MLLVRRGDPSITTADGRTPLMVACVGGHVRCVKALLRDAEAARVNAANDDGETAVWLAAYGGHAKVVRLLLRAGADPTIRDRGGVTALDIAVEASKTACVRVIEVRLSGGGRLFIMLTRPQSLPNIATGCVRRAVGEWNSC